MKVWLRWLVSVLTIKKEDGKRGDGGQRRGDWGEDGGNSDACLLC